MNTHLTKKASHPKKENEQFIEIFASQQWITASDVLKKTEQQGIPPSTVFRWLKKLVQEGVLEKCRKSAKDSKYRLNPKQMPKALWEETTLKFETLSLIDGKVREFGNEHTHEEVFKELAQWVGALTLYSAFKAAEKGRDSLMELPAYYIIEGAQWFVRRPIAYKVLAEMAKKGVVSADKYFTTMMEYQNPAKPIGEEKIAQPALAEIKKALEQAFGTEKMQQLESIFDKVLKEGKSNFEINGESISRRLEGKKA